MERRKMDLRNRFLRAIFYKIKHWHSFSLIKWWLGDYDKEANRTPLNWNCKEIQDWAKLNGLNEPITKDLKYLLLKIMSIEKMDGEYYFVKVTLEGGGTDFIYMSKEMYEYYQKKLKEDNGIKE